MVTFSRFTRRNSSSKISPLGVVKLLVLLSLLTYVQNFRTLLNHQEQLSKTRHDKRIKEGILSRATNCTCVNCIEDEVCGGLWHGNRFLGMPSDEEARSRKIRIVVSHCKYSLSWMHSYLEEYTNIVSVHVISKCGEEVEGAPEAAVIITHENVGRNDHAFAYYISSIIPDIVSDESDDNSVVVFLKDSIDKVHQQGQSRTDLKSLVRVASSLNGFACGLGILDEGWSVYHDTSTLSNYAINSYVQGNNNYKKKDDGHQFVRFNSWYKNLGNFAKALNAPLPPDLVQVCYGGIFAASTSNIFKKDINVWKTLEKALRRGDNIQEGHFAERLWGSLLATPLQPFQIEALRKYSTGIKRHKFAVHGALVRKDCAALKPGSPCMSGEASTISWRGSMN